MILKSKISRAGVFFAVTLSASDVLAAPITYNFDASSGSDSIIGVVTTDGKLGTITGADIVSFDLTISSQIEAPYDYGTAEITSSNGGIFQIVGSDLHATASALVFNFSDDYFPIGEIDITAGTNSPVFAILGDEFSWGTTTGGTIAVGFSAQYGASNLLYSGSDVIATTPVPATLPLFACALGLLGFITWNRNNGSASDLTARYA